MTPKLEIHKIIEETRKTIEERDLRRLNNTIKYLKKIDELEEQKRNTKYPEIYDKVISTNIKKIIKKVEK